MAFKWLVFIQQRILLFGTLPHQQCLKKCCNFKAEALTHFYWGFFLSSGLHEKRTFWDRHTKISIRCATTIFTHCHLKEPAEIHCVINVELAQNDLTGLTRKVHCLRKSTFFFCMTAWNVKKQQKKFYTYINNSNFKNKYNRGVQYESSWMTNLHVWKGFFYNG